LLIIFITVNLYPQEKVPQTTEPQTSQTHQELPLEVIPDDTETDNTDPPESAEEKELLVPYSPFLLHKLNYIIFGNSDDQVKAQLGFKYEVIKESELFLAYSQYVFWDLYNLSSPITEVNLNPEVFWNYGNNIDYFRLGFYEHKSNGRDGLSSRSWNRSYIQYQTSFGNSVNVGVNIKSFYMWGIADENEDIVDYTGYYEAEVFFRFLKTGSNSLTDKEELYIRGGTGKGSFGFDYKKGWLEAGVRFRMLFKAIQPDFYIQLFSGYGEKLVDYNKKDFSVRAGFIIK
jgi:phospholipase A1